MFLEVRHLRLIDAITRQGSVTKAGAVLFLSQSALSHQLKELEDQLRMPLFHRVRKRMIPTRACERLLDGGRPILEQLRALEEEIRGLNDDLGGVVRISTECYTAYHWLPARVSLFARKHPKVEVRVILEATGRPIDALLKGELDLAIVSSTPPKQQIEYRPLFQDDLLVVMRRDHRLATRPYVTAQDFAEETVIVYSSLHDSYFFLNLLKPAGVTPRRILHVQLTEGMVEFIRAGQGVAVLARWAVAPYLQAGDLVGLQLTERPLLRQWSAATAGNRAQIPYLSEFIRLLSTPPGAENAGGEAQRALRQG
jgi:LysR family transcriptional regulator for metE and metH